MNNGQYANPNYATGGPTGQPPQQPAKEPVVCILQGRIIGTAEGGDLFKGAQKKNLKTGQLEFDPKSGLPIWNWVILLSTPKIAIQNDPNGIGRIWTEIWKAFFAKYPNGQSMINPATGFPDPKVFSLKCKDGDLALDQNNKPYSLREGYKGCYVFTLSTRIPVSFFIPQGGVNVQVTEGIKVGDIVNVAVQVTSGDSGLYLNPKMVQLVEKGAAIVAGPNADDVFGAQQPQRSQYVQSVPDPMSNPATAFNQQMPGMQPAQQGPLDFSRLNQQQPAPQAQPAAPNYGAVPNHFHPQQQQAPMPGQYQQPGPVQGGYDPNAVNGAGQVQTPAYNVGGNPTPQQGYATPAGQPGNPYPSSGNGGMPR